MPAESFPRRSSARLVLAHAGILWRVTRNDIAARYAGSIFGRAWFVISPLLILAVYAVVYLMIFRVRVPGLGSVDYVLYIFAGLVPYLATAEALSLGVGSVVAGRSALSSTVFPIDLVPAKAVLSSAGTMLVGLATIIVACALNGSLRWTVLLVPPLLALHGLALLGMVWILSLLNVVFRDLQGLLNVFLMMIMIASPIAYTPEMVPPRLKVLLVLNPFAYLVTAYQKLLITGELPGPAHTLALVAFCLGLFALGGWFFARAKRVIVDYV